MAEAAVSFLLGNLKQLAVHHYNLISNAQRELNLLQGELNRMKGFLKDASKKLKKEEHFKEWEKQIREIVYEAEDTIDACVAHAAAAAKSKSIMKTKNTLTLAQTVENLRQQRIKPVFDKAVADFATLPIADPLDAGAEDTRTKRNKAPRKENVVGFQDETDTLVRYISVETKKLEVISIVGMPGLGKTTVAWKIFHDPRIVYEFPTLIWVYVSQELNKRDMLIAILKKFTQQDMSMKSTEELGPMVYEHLEKGKFLLVMDDVWTTEVWDEIQDILPINNNLGKVLITSRHEKVAWYANKRRPPHQLRFLSKEESWELLQLEVFGNVDDCPEELKLIGERIAQKCHGLPLAIIVIGGILVGKFSTRGGNIAMKSEWDKVAEDSVEIFLMHDDQERQVEKMISLSFDALPYHLRDCFLYLGIFPEDTELFAWKLVELWIAEGFIQEKPNKSLEEVAHDNLKDLIDRNLVMVDKIKPNGEVKTCRLHDTVREFCKHEASFGKQNLFEELKKSKKGVFRPPLQIVDKYRRLCIHSYVGELFQKNIKVPKARSFLCFSKEPIILENKDIAPITDAFSLLRVLDVNTLRFPKFPAKVTNLVHLRYITLSGDELKVLPEAMSKLWNLQTIVINTLARTLEVKADIWSLTQLRLFKTKACLILNKGKGEGGENLQTLSRLSPQSCTTEVFRKAKNVSTLGIRGDLAKILEIKCLAELMCLEKIKLVSDVFPKVPSENPLQRLPHSENFPPNLKILTLSQTYLQWKHMSTIAKISTLEVLKLKDFAFMGDVWNATAEGFDCLEFLYIARTNLKFWKAKKEAFPVLKSLVLTNCENLDSIPLNLGNKLKRLYMERVPKSVVASGRKIEESKQQGSTEHERAGGIEGFKLVIAPGIE